MDFIFASLNLNDSVKTESSFSKCLALSRSYSKMMVDTRQGFLIGSTAVIPFLIFIVDGFTFCFVEFVK